MPFAVEDTLFEPMVCSWTTSSSSQQVGGAEPDEDPDELEAATEK